MNSAYANVYAALPAELAVFYRQVLRVLNGARLDFLVGGAYALALYTGIARHTKDFDVFVRPEDAEGILEVLAREGYRTEMTFPYWLGKAYNGDAFCDVIFSSGNGVARVDDGWFEHAVPAELLGEPVRVCPVEEILWSKGFVVERERYDGADINHLIRARGPDLDWRRVLDRFGAHWRVLLSHLVLFGFVYPGEQGKVPAWVTEELLGRLRDELREPPPDERLCQGTLLSRTQYLIDVKEWGYRDARLVEHDMTPREVRHWTEAAFKGPE
jgi:hypothetical protein